MDCVPPHEALLRPRGYDWCLLAVVGVRVSVMCVLLVFSSNMIVVLGAGRQSHRQSTSTSSPCLGKKSVRGTWNMEQMWNMERGTIVERGT